MEEGYADLVSRLQNRYPNLHYLEKFLRNKNLQYPVRAAVLEFREGTVNQIDFKCISELHDYLNSVPDSNCSHRLYMLEDLCPQYIEILGSYLNVDADLFASQLRDVRYSTSSEYGCMRSLPSIQCNSSSFTLKYYEVRHCGSQTTRRTMKTAANVRREIASMKKKNDKRDDIALFFRRNASFWTRLQAEGAWDG
jgi:hypothetical protein